MEITIHIVAIGLAAVASFILGMYFTTQISEWIDKNRKK